MYKVTHQKISGLTCVLALLFAGSAFADPAGAPPDALPEFTISAPATLTDDDATDDDEVEEYPRNARITPMTGGDFLVEWSITTLVDEQGDAVWRSFNSNSEATSPRIVISEITAGTQAFASAVPCGGRVLASWTTDALDVGDIHGRWFDPLLNPDSGEFSLSEFDDGYQMGNSMACSYDETLVAVVWHSEDIDGNGFGISTRSFVVGGGITGDELQVNSSIPSDDFGEEIAALTAGGFGVVWYNTQDDVSGSAACFGRILDNSGVPLGSSFPIGFGSPNVEYDPEIAGIPGGGFAVVWSRRDEGIPSQTPTDIWLALFDSEGVAVTGPVLVHQATSHDHSQPDIAVNDDGIMTVIWFGPVDEDAVEPDDDVDDDSKADDDSDPVWDTSLIGRQFESDGTPRTDPFVIPSGNYQSMSRPTIGALSDGRFVVVWEGEVFNQQHGLYGRIIGVGDPVDDDTDDDSDDDTTDDDLGDDTDDDDGDDDDVAADSSDDDDGDGCGC